MRSFKAYTPAESGYSARIGDGEWERHRQKLVDLHRQGVPRREMLDILRRDDGFSPSLPQLNARLHIWGLRRYETAKSTPRPTPATKESAVNPRRSNPHGRSLNRFPGDSQILVTEPSGNYPAGALPSKEQNMHFEAQEYHIPNLESSSSEENSTGDEFIILTPSITPETSSGDEYTPSSLNSVSSSRRGLIRNGEPPLERNGGLQMVEGHSTTAACSSLSSSRPVNTRGTSPYAVPKIQMPEDMATTDKLLRCVNDFASLMISEGQKSRPSFVLGQGQSPDHHQLNEIRRQQIRGCINATTESYEGAHYYLKLGEPSKAIRKFQDAVTTVLPMFGEVNLFLLTRLIEIATWSSWKKFPGYEPVVFRFLTASAAQKLGPQHPLVLLLSCFAQAAAISPSYPTIWSCVIDHIDHMADDKVPRAEAQSIRIKAYFYLIRVLRNNGNHCAAIQRCHELIQLCIAIDGTRAFSTNRARYNLGVNYCEAGNQDAAITAYEEARKYRGTADAPHDGWVFAVFASSEIAQLCEQKGDIAKASEYYEEALLGFTQCGGDSSSGALLMLKDLLEFHERHNHVDTLTQIAENYPACYSLLKGGRLDDDQRWVGCRVTTQASRGKVARAWTWTSPMT